MKKICILSLIILIIPLFLTGCYDSVSIENYYYVVAIGIDTSETANIKLSIQIATTSDSGSSSSSQSTESKVYSVDCDTINVGLNILNNYLSKQINLSHCSSVIFSEEIASKGVKEYINTLANNPEIRPTVNIIISSSKATDVFENITKSGVNFSSRYYEFLINSDVQTGYAVKSNFNKFFYSINHETETAIANYITVNDTLIQSDGMSLFKGDKFVTHLTPLETMSYLMVTNQLQETTISIQNPFDNNSSIDILIEKQKNSENKIKLINGKPFIITNVYVNGKIQNLPTFNGAESTDVINNELNNYLTNLIENYYYNIIKKYNLDIVELSDKLCSQFLTTKGFQNLNWNELYKDSFYKVNVESTISTSLYTKE